MTKFFSRITGRTDYTALHVLTFWITILFAVIFSAGIFLGILQER